MKLLWDNRGTCIVISRTPGALGAGINRHSLTKIKKRIFSTIAHEKLNA